MTPIKQNLNETSSVRLIVAAMALSLLILAVYFPVGNFQFMNYDDDLYVTGNPQVNKGLSLSSLRWAFTTTYLSNWHPLAWVSHMLDVSIYGLNSGGHHWISVLWHLLNSLLLFFLLRMMTGAFWTSWSVAVLFAVHPLHVESVAWIAERKDVLAACFMILTMMAYTAYTRDGKGIYYAAAMAFFCLGLLSKAMVVTLPIILLILDWWPLRRSASTIRCLVEKLPFLFLASVIAVITWLAQLTGGAIPKLRQLSLIARLGTAVKSYAVYLSKTIWPAKLAVFYPHPGGAPPAHQLALSFIVIMLLTVLAVLAARRMPAVTTGWAWYLIALLPVSGVIQAGSQAMADRYTYTPLIGVFIAFAYGWRRFTASRPVYLEMIIAVAAVIISLAICARVQLGYWQDSESLFRHALEVTGANAIAEFHLGEDMEKKGRDKEAVKHYRAALNIEPKFHEAHYNLANRYYRDGRLDDAVRHYQIALKLRPGDAATIKNLNLALAKRDVYRQAAASFSERIAINAGDASAYHGLGAALTALGRLHEAARAFSAALRLDPERLAARDALAGVQKKISEAADDEPSGLDNIQGASPPTPAN